MKIPIGELKRPEVHVAFDSLIKEGDRCLEVGAGLGSTPLLREIVSKQSGYVLSIETNKEWHEKVLDVCPDSKYGKTVLTPVVQKRKEDMPSFQYQLTDMYDVIFVDGPCRDGLYYDNESWFKITSDQMGMEWKGAKARGGLLSMFVGHYVWPHLKIGGYIIVGKRLFSAMYFLSCL